ncbi:MAG: hypothetical protein E7084_07490 [Bacteroidales bacterium]|nr:hypothetical protein [Bacteroidales bacterium]MBP3671195.1 hypothetical protein [Bacteroidaceae bacterium]
MSEYKNETEDVRAALNSMCSCMKKKRPLGRKGRLYELLHSWYMPRNECDATCFVRRYSVWCELPRRVNRLLRKEEKNENE